MGSDDARASAAEKNMGAGSAGSGRQVARARAAMMEGISPGRAAAETSPDRTHPRKLFPRDGTAPKKISRGGSCLKNLFSDSIRFLNFFPEFFFFQTIMRHTDIYFQCREIIFLINDPANHYVCKQKYFFLNQYAASILMFLTLTAF